MVSGWSNKDRVPANIDPAVGDWHCTSCGNWNWARRESCNKCQAPRPESAGMQSSIQRGTKRGAQSAGLGSSPTAMAGALPMPIVQPASQDSAPIALQQLLEIQKEIRKVDEQTAALAVQQEQLAARKLQLTLKLQDLQRQPMQLVPALPSPLDSNSLLTMQQAGMYAPTSGSVMAAAATGHPLFDQWVQAKRAKEYKAADRLRDQLRLQGIEPVLPALGAPAASDERVPPGINPAIGDWHCTSCGNWNWARRDTCNKCKAPKPPA